MTLKAGFLCLFLIFLSLGVYYPTTFAPFNSLDDQLFVQQLLNQESFSLASHFAPGGTYDYYRPLLTLTFEADKYLGGLQESFMHLVNILLHTLNVVLVFQLARRFTHFVGREGNLLPFLSAALFCLHPLNTEAVNWIAGRTDLLAGTFVFSSLIFMLKALERRSLFWGGMGAIALLGGALCKETALFVLPGVFLLMVWRPKLPFLSWRARWLLVGFYLVAVLGYFGLRWGAYTTDRGLNHTARFVAQIATIAPSNNSAISDVQTFHMLDAVRVFLKVSGFYAVKLFQPFPLSFAIDRVDGWYLLPGVMLAGILTVLTIRRRPVGVFFLLSAFLGSSALMVVFTRLAWTPIAERYMYIPCGLFSVAVVFGSVDLIERMGWRKVFPAVVPLLLATCAWATVDRNIVWQDNLTLYQDTVRKSPDFGPARNELAMALYAHGRSQEADAIMARTFDSPNQRSSLNQAAVMWQNRQYEGARRILMERLKTPGDIEINILEMLVKITAEMADKETDNSRKRTLYTQMVGWLERMEMLTHNPFHWYRLGRVHLILKNRSDAQRCFAEAAKGLPEHSPYKEPARKLARELMP